MQGRATCAWLAQHGHFVGQLVANQRQRQVVKVRDEYLVRRDISWYSLSAPIYGLKENEVVDDMASGSFAGPSDHQFGGSVTIHHRASPHLLYGASGLG